MSEILLNTMKTLLSELPYNPVVLGSAAAVGIGTAFLLNALLRRGSKSKHQDELPPKLVLQAADFLYRQATAVQTAVIPPELQLARLAFGFIYAKALFVVNELKIADALDDGPKTAEELSVLLHVNADRLSRILRLLAQVGVFEEHSDKTFSNNKTSEMMKENHPKSIVPFLKHLNHDSYSPADELLGSVTTGEPSFVRKFGKNCWDYYGEHPDWKENFAKAMTAVDKINTPMLLEGYDWSSVGTIADIGGSLGTFLEAILLRSPKAKGILFDLPEVIQVSKQHPRWQGSLASRVQFVPGSFFDSVPVADTYLLRYIIHDWSDESSVKILKTIRKSIPAHAKVLICDMIHPEFGQNRDGVFRVTPVDTLMMINCEGKERTESEFSSLLTLSGFKLHKVHRTKGAMSIIEAVPV